MYAMTLSTWLLDCSWVWGYFNQELHHTPETQRPSDRDEAVSLIKFAPGAVNWTLFKSLKVGLQLFLLTWRGFEWQTSGSTFIWDWKIRPTCLNCTQIQVYFQPFVLSQQFGVTFLWTRISPPRHGIHIQAITSFKESLSRCNKLQIIDHLQPACKKILKTLKFRIVIQ